MNELSDFKIVGSEEWCSFPDFNISGIKARIDSGAKTSAIHAVNIQKFKKGNEDWVSFDILPLMDSRSISVPSSAKIEDERFVRSSSGNSERRYVIKTNLTLGDSTWEIEVSLANRDSMGFRMLLGREAMKDGFLVNPSEKYLMGELSENEARALYKNIDASKSGLKIGVLASNPDLYSNRRIMESGEERGHEMVFLNLQHCYMKLDAVNPEVRYRGGHILNDLDAVISRIKPSMTFYGCAMIRQFEALGIPVVNSSNAIIQSRDKLYASQMFLANGLHIPITGFAKSPLDTRDLIHMVNDAPLIIKLLEGTQGMGVVLAETNKAAESVINAFKSLKANILVQEFVKEAQGKDIRCFVVDGKVVASIQRQAAKGEFRANLHMGGQASMIKITSEEKKMAIKAAKVLNLEVAGVDIIRSNRGALLLEVNSSPGLEGIETVTGKDIASTVIDVVERKVKRNVLKA